MQTLAEKSVSGTDEMVGEKSDLEKIEIEDVKLVPSRSTRVVKKLAEGDKEKIVSILLMNKDLFAYSPKDMPIVDSSII